MLICDQSKCEFECPEMDLITTSLRQATVPMFLGYTVDFSYDGEYIGYLVYGGHLEKEEYLPKDAQNGVVFTVGNENSLYINIPKEM